MPAYTCSLMLQMRLHSPHKPLLPLSYLSSPQQHLCSASQHTPLHLNRDVTDHKPFLADGCLHESPKYLLLYQKTVHPWENLKPVQVNGWNWFEFLLMPPPD